MKFLLLLLLCLFSSSVQSCRTVSRSGVTLTGVCPNDTVTVPVGKQLDYECTADYNTGIFLLYWNISGVITSENANPKPPGIGIVGGSSTKSTLTIMVITIDIVLDIQCGLCNISNTSINCFFNPEKLIGTKSVQLITFGKLIIN